MSKRITGRRATDNPRVLRPTGEWREQKGGVYRCMVYLTPVGDEAFTVVAGNLPGVASHGKTIQEALARINEALQGAIANYKQQGRDIPWAKEPPQPERGSLVRCVIVRT